MAKSSSDTMLDGSLNILKNGVTKMVACAGQPTTYASANTIGQKGLAQTTISSADFTLANGDTSGRKVTIGSQAAVPISATGGANHVALLNVSGTRLDYVTTATSQTLTSGNTLTFNAWDIEIRDPT